MVLLQEYQDMPPDMVLIPPFAATHTVFQNIVYTEVLINYHSPQIIEKICSQTEFTIVGQDPYRCASILLKFKANSFLLKNMS